MAGRPTASPPDVHEQADVRFGVRALLAALAVALVAIPFSLLLLLVEARWRPLLEVDHGARDELHELAVRHDAFVTAMKVVSTVLSSPVYAVVLGLVAAWLAWRRLPRLGVFVVVTMGGSWALNAVVKAAVDRARPVLPDPVAHAGGMSFPSGHAQAATVAFSVLLLVFLPVLRGARRRLAIAGAAALVALVGFSRVALGVHYVSDVLAGYVLGAAWVAAMTAVFGVWRRERGRGPVDPARGLEPEHRARIAPGAAPDVGAARAD